MPNYTVQDTQTGKQVTFAWDGDAPPTEKDMEEVFTAARSSSPAPPASTGTTGQRIARAASPYLRPVLEGAGLITGGLVGSGVGPAGTLAGAGLLYSAGKQGADLIDEYAGVKKPEPLLSRFATSGKDVVAGAAMEGGGQLAGRAISAGIKGAGKVAAPLLGRLSGAGSGAVETAVESGKAIKGNPFASQTPFDDALRGKITGQDVVENAKSALQTIKANRGAAYQQKLAEITKNQSAIDLRPVKQKVSEMMKQYNVVLTPKGEIDTSRIAMGKTGREDIREVIETVSRWGTKPGDNTPVGLDTLKRQLDDFYSDSSQARQFVASIRQKVLDTLTKSVPEYGVMTKDYAEATSLIKDVESGLMLRKQGMSGRVVADQTLRRLTSAMRDNFALRRELVDVLGAEGGQDIGQQVAGYALSPSIPHGLAGSAPALVGGGALAAFNPKLWPVLAASSPRVQGEFLRLWGKTLAETAGASQAVGRTSAYALGKGLLGGGDK